MSASAPFASGSAAGSAQVPVMGVMIYDNPKECTSGFASIAGEPATNVRQPEDLANNVIWLTNADFTTFRSL